MKYIDLTHTFTDDMPIFPGDPIVSLKQIAEINKDGFSNHELKTGMHVGTHMDAPLHMIEGGKYMSEITVEHFAGQGVLLDARSKKCIDIDLLTGVRVPVGAIVLVLTGMDTKFRTVAYNSEYPPLTEAFARAMVDAKIHIVGMDFINPDKPNDESYPVHKILLSKNILIIENLTNLESLIDHKEFEVFAFPIKLRADAAPIRVVARIP